MTGRGAAATILLLLLMPAAPAAAQTFGTGIISGTARDVSGAVLPGVAVVVTGPNLRVETVSDGDGRFVVEALLGGPPAVYTVAGTFAGFQPSQVNGITARPGERVEVTLTLAVGCLVEVLYVIPSVEEAVKLADAIYLLRVETSAAPTPVNTGVRCGEAVETTARVLEIAKDMPSRSVSNVVRFLDFDKRQPYQTGTEYLVFLNWRTRVDRYQIVLPALVIPVRGGTLECSVSIDDRFPCASLAEAIETLRRLARPE